MDSTASGGTRSRVWIVAVAALLGLALAPAGAAAETITFEDRAPGSTVTTQYSSQGVTFNGPRAFDYGPGYAHSGTRAIEICRAVEFCGSPPIRADFTGVQAMVGVWVGNNSGVSRQVRLAAFDGTGAAVGHQDATLAPNAPVTTHLTVTATSPVIRALEVTPRDSGGSYDIVVDDVEFTAVGPPPPCTAAGPPQITLTRPFDGTYLQNNSFLLRGSVNNRGAPISEATVVSQGSTTRTAIAYPTPIDADGGIFTVNMNGLLQPGNQKIRVTATNCAGTGVSSEPIVTYAPLPAGARFTQLAPIEVVQTVQSPFNPVPLVAGNGTKRTIARVQLSAEGVSSPITGVSGRLTATRPDGTRPGGPLTVDSLNTISVGANQTLEQARSTLNSGLNFELPQEWIGVGRLHLQLEQLKIEDAQSTLPCLNCENWGDQFATVSFHRVPPARIWLVSVPYTPPGATTANMPRQKDFDFLASWLRRAYPTAEVQITQSALPGVNEQPGFEDDPDTDADEHRDGFLCGDVRSRLSEWIATMPAQPAATRYYGLVSDAGGLFMRGCAHIGGRVGTGPSGDGTWGWDTDNIYTDWYGGHEIAHMYDRKHPDGGCTDSDDDSSYPFIGALIGNSVFSNQGIDVGDASLSPMIPLAHYDWVTWHDVMTYCENQWLSSYTYNGILANLCAAEKGNCPNHAELTRAQAAKGGGPRLAVQGTLNLNNGRVALEPMSALKGLTLTERPKQSQYAIVLRGAGGKQLKSYPIDPEEVSDLPAGERSAAIDEVVPFAKGTERIEIAREGKVLASERVSDNAPTVKLRSPKKRRLDAPVKLRWRARDADGGKLLATVQYAADGTEYVTVAAGLRKRSLKVDPATLPGGNKARFRVVVSDGVLTGIDKSDRVKVAAKPPRVSIATPLDGARVTEGQSIQLIASALDSQDPQLGDNVAWSSDLQGQLGRGPALTVRLEPGTHRITASATNSFGLGGDATITVEVEAIPPTVNAQLIP